MSKNSDKLRKRLETLRQRAIEARANSVGRTQDVAAGFADGLTAAIEALDKVASPEANGERWCVLLGNPLMGVSVQGPFYSFADASAWGDRHAPRAEFWVAPLVAHPVVSGPRLAVDNDGGLQ